MQSVVNSLIYCMVVPSVCIIHMMTLLVSQIFIVGDNIQLPAVA